MSEAKPATPAVQQPRKAGSSPAAFAAASESHRQALKNAVNNPRWLLLKTDGFDPLERRPNFPDIGPHDLSSDAYPPGDTRYYIVQFDGPVQPLWFDRLRQTGAEALEYLPNNAYVVRMRRIHRDRLDALPNVRWVGEFDPGFKIQPKLAQVIRDRAGTDEVLLLISTFRGTSAQPLRPAILGVDPSIDIRHLSDTSQGKGRILLAVRASTLGRLIATLAANPDVEWIEEYHLPQLENDQSIWVIQSGNPLTEASPIWDQGITGFGQIYGAADSGLDTDACQMRFSSSGAAQTLFNTTQPPNVNITNSGNKVQSYYQVGVADAYDDDFAGFHGTHTTGNAVGDNFATLATAANPAHDAGDGMAPAATVIFQDVGESNGSLGGLAVGQTDLQRQAHDSGVRTHNNSYGVPATAGGDQNAYDQEAADLDDVMWRLRHYTLFFSAGNAGPAPGSLGLGGSTAKNTLSTGATINGLQDATTLTDFSSHGPTTDGRFKPDLMAPGGSIVSATEIDPNPASTGDASLTDPPNNNCATSAASGTSFASPTLAGAGILARQYFADGFYPSGTATVLDQRDPSNALIKAVLINSAKDLSGNFTASDGTGGASASRPNFGQGWGRVTLNDALFFPGDRRELVVINDVLNGETSVVSPAVRAAITTGTTHTFTLTNVSTVEGLRVTLNWSDPAGAALANPALVNNLNLEVVDPNTVVYKGNINFVNGFSTAAGATAADNLNSVENVFIQDPVPGTYTVRVIGTNVPGNGLTVPFSSNRQGYALIATGNFSFGDGSFVKFDSVSVSGGKNDDEFLDRKEALDVAVTVRNVGSTDALGATVALSVDPASDVPASAVVISPASIEYGTVISKSTAADTFSITLLDDGNDYSNQQLRIKVDASASSAPATSDVFEIETMADTAVVPMFDFESGLGGWSIVTDGTGNPSLRGPGLVTCEASGARTTPLTELKLGTLNCSSDYQNGLDQRAFSPDVTVPTANDTQLVSLNFWHRVGTESFFDFAQVFVDHDSDGTFNFLTDFNGPDMGTMRFFQAPIGTFFNTGRGSGVAVLFRLFTDAFVVDFPGWFVDGVSVTTKSADPVSDTAAALIAASPSTGAQGATNLNVTITGLNTNFVDGTSSVGFSSTGVTVNSTTVTNATQLTANITISAGATLGTHTITVTTGAEVVTRSILFRVIASALSVQVTPSTWNLGTIELSSTPTTWTTGTPAGGGFFTVLNDGALTEDLTISVAASASWTPSTAPGADTFALGWGQTVTQGTQPPFTNITAAGVALTTGLAVSDFFDFDLEFQAPTTSSDFTEQEIIATVAAQQS